MKTYREPARDIPIGREADVLVAGGGPAGLAAAIAAARAGAKTVLVERFGYLGGTATASLMACVNGFRNQVEPDSTQTVRGIAEEIILRLEELDGLGRSPYDQKEYPTEAGALAYSYAIDTEKFKHVVLKLCVEAGVDLLFHTYVCDSIAEQGALRGIVVENKSGRQAVLAQATIDATGDADVAARAGASFWQARGNEAPRLTDGIMYRIQFGQSRPSGVFACDFGRNAVVWGPGLPAIDATNADELSRAETEARLRIYDDFAGKQREHPELTDARVIETPPLLGIRQTRFVEGEYKLTAQDAISGRRFEDVVAISSCPIISYYGYRRYLDHEGYDIPYRCLVPKGIDDLLIAGRCISSEQQPYESHRAMAPIMAIGQAAGAAAALSVESGAHPRGIDVKRLQQLLRSQGAELRLGTGDEG
jgi:2-polyprenyl-6-methoxyphenol hydroxylase-like FAD-dependent oxidoreductase